MSIFSKFLWTGIPFCVSFSSHKEILSQNEKKMSVPFKPLSSLSRLRTVTTRRYKMKNKKGLTSLFLFAGIALLTGCGGESSTTAQGGSASTGGNGSSTTTETIAYQFLGTFTDATVQMMGFEYEILLNLNTDGTVEGSGYNILSMDTSTYTENSGFYDDWIGGSWEEGEDEEGQECIVLETVFGKDAVNIMPGGAPLTGTEHSYNLYPDADGTITFTLDWPVFSGRTGEVTGSSTITYHDKDSFIKGVAYQFDEPENSLAMFADETAHFHLYCLDDNTTVLASGKEDPGSKDYKYSTVKNGTWSYENEKLSFKFDGDENTYEAKIEGTKATLEYRYVLYGDYGIDLVLTLDDVTPLTK